MADNHLDPNSQHLDNLNANIGIYQVRFREDGSEYLSNCSLQFAKMLGYENEDEMIGMSIVDLFPTQQDYENWREAWHKSTVRGKDIVDRPETLKRKDGRPIGLRKYITRDYDEHNRLIGRTSVVIYSSMMDNLLIDIGHVLHRYTTTLMSIRHRMDEIAQAFYIEDSPFGPDISRELKIEEDVSPPIMKATKQFQQSLRNLLEHIETNEKQHLFEDDEFEKLTKTDKLLQNIKQLVPYPEHRPGTLLEASRSVIRICRDATAREVIPRELCRDVISRGGTIENLACLQRIHAFASLIVETDYEVEALRGFLNYYHKRPETFTVESVSSMLGDSIELMSGYAKSKRIKLRRSASHADAMVKVVRPDITSAINNVLQNAIKYSWQSRSHQYVVHVRHYQIQEMVAIEIENTGVPIPQNEIDSGIIFEMGFRGRKSGERARRGTGIGLHESREIVESHLGKITITSTPMGDDPEASPNKTIVTIYLPIHAG